MGGMWVIPAFQAVALVWKAVGSAEWGVVCDAVLDAGMTAGGTIRGVECGVMGVRAGS